MNHSDQFALICTRRAEALRVIASDATDIALKDAMLTWAGDYDRLAERAIEMGALGMPRKVSDQTATDPTIRDDDRPGHLAFREHPSDSLRR